MSFKYIVREDDKTPFPDGGHPGILEATVEGDPFVGDALWRLQRRVYWSFPYDGELRRRTLDRYLRVCWGVQVHRETVEDDWDVMVAYTEGLEGFMSDLSNWLRGNVFSVQVRETGEKEYGIIASDPDEAVSKYESLKGDSK